MKKFDLYVQESAIDIPKHSLDPTVFETANEVSEPIMHPSIKKQIIQGIQDFERLMIVNRCYVVGSILTKAYTSESDIDVNLEVNREEIDDLMEVKLLAVLKTVNGKLATGTTHPINYYILMAGDVDESSFDGMYDVMNEKWLKVPKDLPCNVADYMNNFEKMVSAIDLTMAQLKRDIIDFTQLSKYTKEDITNIKEIASKKLEEITTKVEALVDIKSMIKNKRKGVFKRPMTPQEIEKFKSKNYLPENIVYKLLQKYYYWDFIQRLESILNSKEKLDYKDINQIKQAEKTVTLKSFEGFIKTGKILTEKVRNIKLKKIDWTNPSARSRSHLQKMNRGMDRKNLRQVPTSMQSNRQQMVGAMGTAKKIIDRAKTAPSGIWRITPSQVKWLSVTYHHNPPDARKNIKHLGNTGIIVWRKAKGVYYLVKPTANFF